MTAIAVLGAGSWGTTLANLLAAKGDPRWEIGSPLTPGRLSVDQRAPATRRSAAPSTHGTSFGSSTDAGLTR